MNCLSLCSEDKEASNENYQTSNLTNSSQNRYSGYSGKYCKYSTAIF